MMPDEATEQAHSASARVSSFFIENLLGSAGKESRGQRKRGSAEDGHKEPRSLGGIAGSHCAPLCCQVSAFGFSPRRCPLRESPTEWYRRAHAGLLACPSPDSKCPPGRAAGLRRGLRFQPAPHPGKGLPMASAPGPRRLGGRGEAGATPRDNPAFVSPAVLAALFVRPGPLEVPLRRGSPLPAHGDGPGAGSWGAAKAALIRSKNEGAAIPQRLVRKASIFLEKRARKQTETHQRPIKRAETQESGKAAGCLVLTSPSLPGERGGSETGV